MTLTYTSFPRLIPVFTIIHFILLACIIIIFKGKHTIIILIKMTNKMQLCRILYYSIVPWLLCMFRAILSLIIRSILTVITASGFIHMCCCQLLSWLRHNSIGQQHMWIKPEAVITVKMLKTCRAAKEQWNNKLSYTVGSCRAFL